MKSKEILIQLINYLNDYEQDAQKKGGAINLTDFLGYLNSTHVPENVKVNAIKGNVNNDVLSPTHGNDTDISILVVFLFRYAKGYMKKALKESVINSADEFSFLITLMTYESLTKTELIQKQVMEKTSGTEIINRLLKLELMDQFNDEIDRRSMRLKITIKGKTEIVKILPQMKMVSELVAGNLTETEKITLAFLLRKLECFHNDIFTNKKDVQLTDLLNHSLN
jgi:DNA-binding MarR family transcriptional regulator